tara:strand:- start:1790 stop:2035 length:246 start_codon:yes stop_codon:yes gene_type:complete
MPVKFSPSTKKYIKGSRTKWSWEHDYIKAKSTEFLFEYINKEEGQYKPKTRTKCIKELQRRGIKLVWVERKDQENELQENK